MSGGKGVVDELPDHLFRWAEAVGRALSAEMRTSTAPRLELLGGRRARLLQLIPREGMRVTDLARRARVTKQALGQLVNTLERDGLVESVADPADARVRLVRRTPRGDAMADDIDAAIAAAEGALRRRVGAKRYDAMVETMRDLGRDVRL